MRLSVLNFWLRHFSKRYLSWEQSFARARRGMDGVMRIMPMPAGAQRRDVALGPGAVPAVEVTGFGDAATLLWLHGGAYCLGSAGGYAPLAAGLARRIGGRAVLPEYRLAPEHPFPAGFEDCAASYRALLDGGTAPERMVLGGDSAGGGLAFALLHHALEAGLPLPACVISFSPWVDLTASGESWRSLADREVLLPAERVAELRDAYIGGGDPADPRASPLFGSFRGAPPVLIQSSAHEVLRDDARAMAARLREHGAACRHDERDSLPHVWQLFAPWLPEAARALDEAAAFARAHLPGAADTRRVSAR